MTSSENSPKPPPVDLERFLTIPWCAKLLSDANITIWHPPASRVLKPSGEDELWAVTLNTPDTFPTLLTFYREPDDSNAVVEEIKSLLSVGRGVQGYPGVVHGGIVMTILDEITGYLPQINRKRRVFPRVSYMTGYLNTSFLKPVKTPSTMLITARILKNEGRKLLVEGWIEDETGEVLAKAEALFIALKSKF